MTPSRRLVCGGTGEGKQGARARGPAAWRVRVLRRRARRVRRCHRLFGTWGGAAPGPGPRSRTHPAHSHAPTSPAPHAPARRAPAGPQPPPGGAPSLSPGGARCRRPQVPGPHGSDLGPCGPRVHRTGLWQRRTSTATARHRPPSRAALFRRQRGGARASVTIRCALRSTTDQNWVEVPAVFRGAEAGGRVARSQSPAGRMFSSGAAAIRCGYCSRGEMEIRGAGRERVLGVGHEARRWAEYHRHTLSAEWWHIQTLTAQPPFCRAHARREKIAQGWRGARGSCSPPLRSWGMYPVPGQAARLAASRTAQGELGRTALVQATRGADAPRHTAPSVSRNSPASQAAQKVPLLLRRRSLTEN